jgi:Multicopper oxidase
MDTVNAQPGASVDLIMDFTDPIIRGISLFHCHLLKHEDKRMMAEILFPYQLFGESFGKRIWCDCFEIDLHARTEPHAAPWWMIALGYRLNRLD